MMLTGGCLCGAVAFRVIPPLRHVIVCHCTQCRKWSGHAWAASSVPLEQFQMTRDDGLAWFSATPHARRGFCRFCGSSLLWDPVGEGRVGFAPGAIDGPTGLTLRETIFLHEAGDYLAAGPEDGAPDAAGADAAGTGAAASERLHASCLCGAARFSVAGPAGPVTACHCTQCRKLSGHFSASFDVADGQLAVSQGDTIANYRTPGGGERRFCTACGSSLWFRDAAGGLSVEAGCVDGPTGGHLAEHIFTGDRGDYYTLDDGLPQATGA